MINYKDVSKYLDKIDENKRIDVLLNRYHCWLFLKLVPKSFKESNKFFLFFETIYIYIVWTFVYIFARNLIIMVTFMKYPECYDFYELPDGMFVVELNPDSPFGDY